MTISVSVVLCCHNSAARLQATLTHLAAVQVPAGMAWEVLVVDNASTDDTAARAAQLWAQVGAPAPLRVLPEPRLGLNHARWTGIRAAQYDIVSFVDDDNWVDAQWLCVLDRVFAEHPQVGAVGGLAEPAFEAQAPDWFAQVQHGYACGPQADAAGPVPSARGYLHGAGLSLRRGALLALDAGGFSPRQMGRTGGSLAAGEDAELCHALVKADWTLWYEPDLRLRHYMPAGRLTPAYAHRLCYELGRSGARLAATRDHRRILRFRPAAVTVYAMLWVAHAVPLPGRRRKPFAGSYHRGRLAEAIGLRR